MIKTLYDERVFIKGKQEGKEEGKQEGRQEGEKAKAIEMAYKLIKRGLNIADMAEDTGLSVAEIEEAIKEKQTN